MKNTVARFIVPKFELKVKREYEIPLNGTIVFGAQGTLVTDKITFPFRIVKVKMKFRNDSAYLLWLYWLVSTNNVGSTTGIPSGDNVFSYATPVPYFLGEDEEVEVTCNYADRDGNKYIKLHAVNNCAYDQTVKASVTVSEI